MRRSLQTPLARAPRKGMRHSQLVEVWVDFNGYDVICLSYLFFLSSLHCLFVSVSLKRFALLWEFPVSIHFGIFSMKSLQISLRQSFQFVDERLIFRSIFHIRRIGVRAEFAKMFLNRSRLFFLQRFRRGDRPVAETRRRNGSEVFGHHWRWCRQIGGACNRHRQQGRQACRPLRIQGR